MKRKNEKRIKEEVFWIFIIGICSIFLFFRCFFSFTWSDESFYLTIVHRFWLGERIFADEWYTTQLSTPILLPFYAIYQWCTGGNEGIYLYFRLIYWMISSFVSIFCFVKLKKSVSNTAAAFCALIYLLYSRANIGGMSYYNMTLTFVLIATVMVYGQLSEEKVKKIELFFVGVFLALAVVVTPYLAIPYFVIMGILLMRKKNRFLWKEILCVIAGTGITAIMYMTYVLEKVSISQIVQNIPYVLSEPELQKTNPLLAIPMMFVRIAWRYKWTIVPYICLIIILLYKQYKKEVLSRKEINWIWSINLGIFAVNYFLSSNMIGCINIALALFGVIILLCNYVENVKWKRSIQSFGVAGASVVFAFAFSSDTGLDAMTIGFVLLAIAVVMLVFDNKGIKETRKLYYVVFGVITVVIFQSAFLRIGSVYRDAPLKELTTKLTSGPAKGLYTTKEHAKQYRDLQDDIANYVREDDIVFYSKNCFWSYLCTENEFGVPSSWRINFSDSRIEAYYTLKPEKIPTCVFVLKPEYGSFESSMIQNNEKADRPNENKIEGFLYNYMLENNYEKIETKSAIVFRKVTK